MAQHVVTTWHDGLNVSTFNSILANFDEIEGVFHKFKITIKILPRFSPLEIIFQTRNRKNR